MRLSTGYICLVIVITVFACSKEPDSPPPPVAKKKISLSLYFQAETPDNKWQLVVATTAGDVILDTLANTNATAYIDYYTNEKWVDVSFIYKNKADAKFYMGTYRGVDPTGWDILKTPIFGYLDQIRGPSGPTVPARINYTNPPPFTGSPYFFPNAFTLIKYNPSTIVAEYRLRNNGVPAYLLLPEQGYYKLHLPKSNNDTVDLSGMEKAVRTPFDVSPSLSDRYAILYGVTDSTDRRKDIELYNYTINAKMPDLLYPVQPFQKYDLLVGASSNANEFFTLYSYGNSIPKVYNLLTSADYSISSSSADNFSVSFTGEKPFYYLTQWDTDQINWIIYSPVESNQLNPVKMIGNLNRKILAGVNSSSIKLTQFWMERSKTMNYNQFFSKNMSSSERVKTPDFTTVLYVKTY